MGGRGRIQKDDQNYGDRWNWIKDVSENRLKNYIKRSTYVGDRPDPAGRSIHDVAFHAEKELSRRRNK